jgi:hypothetical protein
LSKNKSLQVAGAMNSLYYTDFSEENPVLTEIKGDKKSVGGALKKNETERIFTLNEIPLHENMIFYTCTDGFADEIGGKDERKYSSKRFRELLQSIAALPMSEQRAVLEREMSAWLGDNKQIDDVLVIGFKVSMTL